MRFILGFLSGVLGMLAGWAGLAFLVVGLLGPGMEGATAMAAFFTIGPLGGLVGFVLGVVLFLKAGIVRNRGMRFAATQTSTPQPNAPVASAPRPTAALPAKTRISLPFAVAILGIAAGLAWWGWYEFVRSPYLTHGYMTLNLEFKLPPGAALPADVSDVHIQVSEGGMQTYVSLGPMWHGHLQDNPDIHVILATATLSRKASARRVDLELPGIPEQSWPLDRLSSDPEPTDGYTPWQLADGGSPGAVEMNYSLTADR